MKATLKGKILNADRIGGNVKLQIEAGGKVVTTNIAAQEAAMSGIITLKGLVADQLKFGASLTITISDEESNEGDLGRGSQESR